VFRFLVVSDGDIIPLERTINSIFMNCASIENDFYVFIQPAKNHKNISQVFSDQRVHIGSSPDTGIYSGMNLLIEQGVRQNDQGLCCFLNSGDELIRVPDVSELPDMSVLYSDVLLGHTQIIKSSVFPRFLKMPHHQSMFIPASFFVKFAYRYPEHFSIAGDLHLKMKLWSVGYRYIKVADPIAKVEDGGVSTKFSLASIGPRSREMVAIAREYFGNLHSIFLYALYLLWYAVRAIVFR
jgi:hypothetical protein